MPSCTVVADEDGQIDAIYAANESLVDAGAKILQLNKVDYYTQIAGRVMIVVDAGQRGITCGDTLFMVGHIEKYRERKTFGGRKKRNEW